jgi:hypothetical protein
VNTGRDRRPEPSGTRSPVRPGQTARPLVRLPDGSLAQPKPGQRVQASQKRATVDICLVFDTTGSMSDKIDGLVHCMVDFVGELAKLRLDWQLTAVPFGDLTVPGDRVVGDLPFVSTREAAERLIQTMPRFSGGGNIGESSLEAVLAALRKPYRSRSLKVLVILTDEPPLEGIQLTFGTVARALQAKEVICFVASPNLAGYRRWARENGGVWYPISSHMDTNALLKFLRSLVKDVATVAKAVHDLGGGSVRRYLEASGKRPGELPSGR